MRKIMFVTLLVLIVAATLFGVSAALAEDRDNGPRNGYGLRLGYGSGPEQFVAGAQALLGQEFKYLRLAPSFDVGWGDDMTTYVLNGDLEVHLGIPNTRSYLYGGAGAGLAVWDRDDADTDTEIGLNLLAGARLSTHGRTNFNLEARFGISDVPDFRILAGVLFGSGEPAAQ
jgi:hypothetical protein